MRVDQTKMGQEAQNEIKVYLKRKFKDTQALGPILLHQMVITLPIEVLWLRLVLNIDIVHDFTARVKTVIRQMTFSADKNVKETLRYIRAIPTISTGISSTCSV